MTTHIFHYVSGYTSAYAAICKSPEDVRSEVSKWMTSDPTGVAEDDDGNDMVPGVVAALLKCGYFTTEESPVFLTKVEDK